MANYTGLLDEICMEGTESIKPNKRSEGAKKMWKRRKEEDQELSAYDLNRKKLDWHLFWVAAGVIVTLATIIIGSYVSILNRINDCKTELSREISQVNAELVKIQTVLILKGVAPKELFTTQNEEK